MTSARVMFVLTLGLLVACHPAAVPAETHASSPQPAPARVITPAATPATIAPSATPPSTTPSTTPSSAPLADSPRAQWDGSAPFECDVGERLIDGVHAQTRNGVAIRVSGDCHLSIRNSVLNAPLLLRASDRATIAISGSTLDGSVRVIDAQDDARVVVLDGIVTGPLRHSGNARITFEKGSTHHATKVWQYDACSECLSAGEACNECHSKACRKCLENSAVLTDPTFCIPHCQ